MNTIKYTIFKTSVGFFGLAGTDQYLLKTTLPCEHKSLIEKHLLQGLSLNDYDFPVFKLDPDLTDSSASQIKYDQDYFHSLQNDIISYFNGTYDNSFENIPIMLPAAFSPFAIKVLGACRVVTVGTTITYSQLAASAGFVGASRAAGSVLAKNPLPLIIPCHRIIKSDGSIGYFTAPGGPPQKIALIQLEKQMLCT